MKKIGKLIFAAAALLALLMPAEVSARQGVKTFEVPKDYSALVVSSAINVTYSPDVKVVTITGDEKDIERIECKVTGGKVSLASKKSSNGFRITNLSSRRGHIDVVVPSSSMLSEITVSGASSFKAECSIEAREVEIEVSGASSLSAEVYCDDLDVDVSGASNVYVSGKSENASYSVSGASRAGSADVHMKSTVVHASVSGASSLCFSASEQVSGSASGASHVSYWGNPRGNVSTSGASSVSVK